jgi:hypothetical protein
MTDILNIFFYLPACNIDYLNFSLGLHLLAFRASILALYNKILALALLALLTSPMINESNSTKKLVVYAHNLYALGDTL